MAAGWSTRRPPGVAGPDRLMGPTVHPRRQVHPVPVQRRLLAELVGDVHEHVLAHVCPQGRSEVGAVDAVRLGGGGLPEVGAAGCHGQVEDPAALGVDLRRRQRRDRQRPVEVHLTGRVQIGGGVGDQQPCSRTERGEERERHSGEKKPAHQWWDNVVSIEVMHPAWALPAADLNAEAFFPGKVRGIPSPAWERRIRAVDAPLIAWRVPWNGRGFSSARVDMPRRAAQRILKGAPVAD